MNVFFVSGKQMCGGKSLNSPTQAQVTRNETGVENCLRILNHAYEIKHTLTEINNASE